MPRKNQQHWLTSKIPKDHLDKDAIIQIVLFECLVHYIEKELDGKWTNFSKGDLDHVSKEYMDRVTATESDLFAAYHYITRDRPQLLLAGIDTDMRDADTEEIIFKHRGYLWT